MTPREQVRRAIERLPDDASLREFARQAVEEAREIRTIEVPIEGVPDGRIQTDRTP